MELLITDLTNDEVIEIPVLPEEFKVSYNNNFQSYNVLGIGEIKFPDGVQLSGISWDSFFETEKYSDFPYVSGPYNTPQFFHDKLERIKIDGRIVRIMLTDTPINFECYLDSFQPTFRDANGRMYYSVSFIQAKDIDVMLEGEDGTPGGSLRYRVHVRDQGWTDWAKDGEVSGTTGQCLRMEALQIRSFYPGISLEYESHLKDSGWSGVVESPAISGTVGESRRLEAVRIRLKGDTAENYDVNYRLHLRDDGWMSWSKNFENNGSVGLAKRAEAIQIKITDKDSFSPHDTFISDSQLSYKDTVGGFIPYTEDQKCEPTRTDYSDKSDLYNTYTLKSGDTLYYIAQAYYGDGNKWERIYEANKDAIGSDPTVLPTGYLIKIPV